MKNKMKKIIMSKMRKKMKYMKNYLGQKMEKLFLEMDFLEV